MAIFRKKVKRYAEVTFAIEAKSKEDAQKLFDQWCIDDSNNKCELSDTFAMREEEDEEIWMNVYQNLDEYNRACCCDDFHILCKKPKEPKYDLYFSYEDKPNTFKAYLGCTMTTVIEKVQENNKDYILKPSLGSYQAGVDAFRRGSNLLYYNCERREA